MYKIEDYKDLNHLLVDGWHWHGLNEVGDFCYIVHDSVEFYISKR